MQRLLLAIVVLVTTSFSSCEKEVEAKTTCVKVKLAIKGICMNYVMQDVDGVLPKELVEAEWKDPETGTVYNNAFSLASHCSFPETIKEGDIFYITVITEPLLGECAVCLAYRPVPDKKIRFSICQTPKPAQQ